MAIDYFGAFPCKVREAVSDADLLRMDKARGRAQLVLQMMRSDPQTDRSKSESEWTFNAVVQGPDGPRETQVNVADLVAEGAPLDALAPHCTNCPHNVRGTDFGCGGVIHYPVTAAGERWLLSRLPDNLDTPPGQLLTRAIADFGFDGRVVDAARRRKELYEADQPAERKWGGFFSKKTRITSSQLIQMAFAVGSLQPAHARMLAYFLGFLDADFKLSDNPADRPQPADDHSVAELKLFFRVAAMAGTGNVPVLVDA